MHSCVAVAKITSTGFRAIIEEVERDRRRIDYGRDETRADLRRRDVPSLVRFSKLLLLLLLYIVIIIYVACKCWRTWGNTMSIAIQCSSNLFFIR